MAFHLTTKHLIYTSYIMSGESYHLRLVYLKKIWPCIAWETQELKAQRKTKQVEELLV
jgi:hypothetical protein